VVDDIEFDLIVESVDDVVEVVDVIGVVEVEGEFNLLVIEVPFGLSNEEVRFAFANELLSAILDDVSDLTESGFDELEGDEDTMSCSIFFWLGVSGIPLDIIVLVEDVGTVDVVGIGVVDFTEAGGFRSSLDFVSFVLVFALLTGPLDSILLEF